jgi:hypothetical protein
MVCGFAEKPPANKHFAEMRFSLFHLLHYLIYNYAYLYR